MINKHTPALFNTDWVSSDNRFCDGDFQGVKVDTQEINHAYCDFKTAQRVAPHYWTKIRKRELDRQYKAAIAKAEGK